MCSIVFTLAKIMADSQNKVVICFILHLILSFKQLLLSLNLVILCIYCIDCRSEYVLSIVFVFNTQDYSSLPT